MAYTDDEMAAEIHSCRTLLGDESCSAGRLRDMLQQTIRERDACRAKSIQEAAKLAVIDAIAHDDLCHIRADWGRAMRLREIARCSGEGCDDDFRKHGKACAAAMRHAKS